MHATVAAFLVEYRIFHAYNPHQKWENFSGKVGMQKIR